MPSVMLCGGGRLDNIHAVRWAKYNLSETTTRVQTHKHGLRPSVYCRAHLAVQNTQATKSPHPAPTTLYLGTSQLRSPSVLVRQREQGGRVHPARMHKHGRGGGPWYPFRSHAIAPGGIVYHRCSHALHRRVGVGEHRQRARAHCPGRSLLRCCRHASTARVAAVTTHAAVLAAEKRVSTTACHGLLLLGPQRGCEACSHSQHTGGSSGRATVCNRWSS